MNILTYAHVMYYYMRRYARFEMMYKILHKHAAITIVTTRPFSLPNRNYSAILATLQITLYALGV